MLKVKTFILNPKYTLENSKVEKYIKAKTFSFKENSNFKSSLYCYIGIYDGDSNLIFESSLESCPQYWLIILQIIEETLEDGMGEWEFPTLLKFEAINSESIRLTQNESSYIFPKSTLLTALLEECKLIMDAMGVYTEYPPEAIESFYNKIETLHNKIG